MKITKTQLKQIIKEELGKMLEADGKGSYEQQEKGPYDTPEEAEAAAKSRSAKTPGFVWEVEERRDGYYIVEKEMY